MRGVPETLARLPILNSTAVEKMVVGLCAGAVGRTVVERALRPVARLQALRQVLVVADMNIGDSFLLKPAVARLAAALPETAVDYVCHAKAAPMIAPDPAVRSTYGWLRGGESLPEEALRRLRELTAGRSYDLIVNFCPFLGARRLAGSQGLAIDSLPLIVGTLAGHRNGGDASIPAAAVRLMTEIVGRLPKQVPQRPVADAPPEMSVYLGAARAEAVRFAFERAIGSPGGGVVFVNPDTSNRSTFLGAPFFAELVERLLRSPLVGRVILGRGFTFSGVEGEIVGALREQLATRVVVPPAGLALDDFAALVDRCAVYVGGDTGPLHLAASRKLEPEGAEIYANRTAVIGLFKATDPRIYGYDSRREGFLDSSQDAPAWTVEARPACKNLTCSLQRLTETCAAVACGEAIDPAEVARLVLGELERRAATARLAAVPDAGAARW